MPLSDRIAILAGLMTTALAPRLLGIDLIGNKVERTGRVVRGGSKWLSPPDTATIGFTGLLMLTGCATMAAYQEETRRYQALADQATHALGGGEVPINVVAGTTGSASCGAGTITIGRDGNTRWLLAHELGHHISGHCGQGIASEMEANAPAIRVLQVWGMTEEEAFRMTANHILGLHRSRGQRPLPGHSYCVEFHDLRSRYPQYPPKDPAKVNKICPGTG